MPDAPTGSDAWRAQDKGPVIVAACWAVTALSTVFVVGRLYVRGVILKKFYSDDYFSLLGLICGYVATAFSTVAVVSFGDGKHTAVLTIEQQQGAIFWATIGFCPGVLSFSLPKLAVVSLLTRILDPSRFHKWVLWTMVTLCQLNILVCIGILLGRCTPMRSMWDFSVEGHCFSANVLVNFALYAAAYSAFLDIYLATYPSIVLFRLQMSLRDKLAPPVPQGISSTWKKVALAIALGIGASSGIVAIYKSTKIASLGSDDFSYDTSELVIWTIIEGSTILIASSIPVLRPLVPLALRRSSFGSSHDPESTARIEFVTCKSKPRSEPVDELGIPIDGVGEREEDTSGSVSMQPDTSCAGAMGCPLDSTIQRSDIHV